MITRQDQELAAFLAALSDPVNIACIRAMLTSGTQTLYELRQAASSERATNPHVQKHLAPLLRLGIIAHSPKSTSPGPLRYFLRDPESVRMLLSLEVGEST